jgi:hypothetical protein
MLKYLVFISVFFTVQTSAIAPKQRTPRSADKSALYERYPQLISNQTNPCVQGLNQLLINRYTIEQYDKMVQSSMHGLDDLGSEYLCNSEGMENFSVYTSLMLNITHLPTALISGLCLPKSCSLQNMNWFNTEASNKLNSVMEAV